MIKNSLQVFADRVIEARAITAADVASLRSDVLPDGVQTREEVDVLVALDRAAQADGVWADYLLSEVVGFAVWTSRPTGVIDHDLARWLVTTLSCGHGPTPTAARIAFEVVREAQRVDEMLLTFVLGACRPTADGAAPMTVNLAA